MKLASHLRRSRHGVFYFRIVFPQILATILGQSELTTADVSISRAFENSK